MRCLVVILLSSFALASGHFGDESLASRVCRPGPPLPPPDDGRKNCLIIGDSVSLGYTPIVVGLMNSTCQVQHAPFSGDGGALDTKYALQCLHLWLVTSQLNTTHYDAIIINSGLHDANYSGRYPEEFTPLDQYSANLKVLKARLLASAGSPRLGFATTTPVGFNATLNTLVTEYNNAAHDVMSSSPPASMFDLYGAVIKVCGQPPYNCSIQDENGVHFHPSGYQLLGKTVADGFHALLSQKEESADLNDFDLKSVSMEGTPCPGGNTFCPQNSTCVKDSFSKTGYGCCLAQPTPGVDCHDNWHCCPHQTQCVFGCNMFGCTCMSTVP